MELRPGKSSQKKVFIDGAVILDRRNRSICGRNIVDRLLDPEQCVEHFLRSRTGVPFNEVGHRRRWHLLRQFFRVSDGDRQFTGQHVKTPSTEAWEHPDMAK